MGVALSPLTKDEVFLILAEQRGWAPGDGRLLVRDGAAGGGAAGEGAPAPRDPRLARSARALSLGALAREWLPALRSEGLSLDDERLLERIARCRTTALGGVLESCAAGCGFAQVLGRACGDRHCPACGGLKGARWLEQRVAASLPVAAFHVVITLPPELRALARENPARVYDLLLAAALAAVRATASEVLLEPVELGLTAVLHTWNRWGAFHPHVHLIVSAGGLSQDERWLEAAKECLLPPWALREHWRVAFASGLERYAGRGELSLGGAPLAPAELERLLARVRDPERWVEVYAKGRLEGPQETFRYLARYVTRLGVHNARLVHYARETGVVTLTTKKSERFQLHAKELLRRFLLHRLPRGLHRIRHAGLYAPRSRAKRERARALLLARGGLAVAAASASAAPVRVGPDGKPRRESILELYRRLLGVDLTRCPCCGGPLHVLELGPWKLPAPLLAHLDRARALAAGEGCT